MTSLQQRFFELLRNAQYPAFQERRAEQRLFSFFGERRFKIKSPKFASLEAMPEEKFRDSISRCVSRDKDRYSIAHIPKFLLDYMMERVDRADINSILILNALDGNLAVELREYFPEARIMLPQHDERYLLLSALNLAYHGTDARLVSLSSGVSLQEQEFDFVIVDPTFYVPIKRLPRNWAQEIQSRGIQPRTINAQIAYLMKGPSLLCNGGILMAIWRDKFLSSPDYRRLRDHLKQSFREIRITALSPAFFTKKEIHVSLLKLIKSEENWHPRIFLNKIDVMALVANGDAVQPIEPLPALEKEFKDSWLYPHHKLQRQIETLAGRIALPLVELGEIGEIQPERSLEIAESETVKLLRPKVFAGSLSRYSFDEVPATYLREKSMQKVQKNDIIIPRQEARTGEFLVIREREENLFADNSVIVFAPNTNRVIPQYLEYSLTTEFVQMQFDMYLIGIGFNENERRYLPNEPQQTDQDMIPFAERAIEYLGRFISYLENSERENQQIFPKPLEFIGYIHKDGDKIAYFRDKNGDTVKVSSSRRFIVGKFYVSLAKVNRSFLHRKIYILCDSLRIAPNVPAPEG